jgi:glutamate-1-semialdehyde 2,1-aminomutase
MTTLGKIIGGGLPVAAYGGRKDIMDCVSPAGPVYQAGTLSGNPLAMAAGLETLRIITEDPDYVEKACAKTKILTDGLKAAADEAGAAVQVHRAGTMFSVFFSAVPVTNYATSEASDQEAFRRYFLSMLEQGIYLAPSQFETNFVSGVHSDEDIEKTITAARTAFEKAVVRG